MNLQVNDLDLFVRIVDLGSLSAAARERNVPVSQVTRALARIEKSCRTRLLHRNTHGLSLTDEGDDFLLYARGVIDSTADLQGRLSGRSGGPAGWVRLSVSAVLAQAVIAPSLSSLYDRHPGLHIDICAEDRIVDMAREGIDVAIRTGTPASESIVARPIGELTRSLYASPAYIERHGMPTAIDELSRHRLLANASNPALNRWSRGPGQAEFVVQGHTRTDNTAVLLALAVNGVGIGRIVDLIARPLVKAGLLVAVLPEAFPTRSLPMYAVMLQERHRLPKVRACIEFWAEWLASS